MLAHLTTLAQESVGWQQPTFDWHAFAPEIILVATIVVLILLDLFTSETNKWAQSSIAGIGLLVAMIPVVTLAYDGADRILFGGAYVVDDFALGAQGAVPHRRVRGRPAVDELHRRGRLLGGRVLPADPVLGARHDGHGLGARPRHDLRRARAAVDPGLHARRVAQARPEGQRSRPEVLPDGCVRLGDHAVRHVAALRVQPAAPSWRTSASSTSPWPEPRPFVTLGIVFVHHRLRLQGLGGAVPHVGTRHLRGRAHPGHRVPGRRVEGRRVRGPADPGLRGLLGATERRVASRSSASWPVASMFVGNFIALRQTNIVRMLAYSGIAQAGYMLAPLAVAGTSIARAKPPCGRSSSTS